MPVGRYLAGMILAVLSLDAAPAPARGWIGLGYLLRVSTDGSKFLYVHRVAPGGPAERAGIKERDLIVKLGGKAIQFRDELAIHEFMSSQRPGTKLPVILVRDGKQHRTSVTVTPVPAEFKQLLSEAEKRAKIGREHTGKTHKP